MLICFSTNTGFFSCKCKEVHGSAAKPIIATTKPIRFHKKKKKKKWKQNERLIWIILEPAFVICDYEFFFWQFDILHGQHKNEMEEVSGLIREESKSQNSNDRVVYELRAEVRFWIE